MTKFWTVVTLLLVVALGLVAVNWLDQPRKINFSDLETECRYDRGNTTFVSAEDNVVTFSGYFSTASPEANLDYKYSISDSNDIELDIIARDSIMPDRFYNSCLASVVYEAETVPLDSGRYTVTVRHNGVEQEKVRVRIE